MAFRILRVEGGSREALDRQQKDTFHCFLRIPAYFRCVHVRCAISFLGSSVDKCCRPMLAIGAVAERGRLGPLMVFTFLWATLVYDPIAHWLWNVNGWSSVLGGIDFAGGTPVHVSSGTAALAISIYLRPRLGYGTERLAYKPNHTAFICLGTAMMWFGWFGFNGGSALSANLRAASACFVTNLAASTGGLTWVLLVCVHPIQRYRYSRTLHRTGD